MFNRRIITGNLQTSPVAGTGKYLDHINEVIEFGNLSGVKDMANYMNFYYLHILPFVADNSHEISTFRLRSYLPAYMIISQLKLLPYATQELSCVKMLAGFAAMPADKALTFIKTLCASDLNIPALTLRISNWAVATR